MTHESFVGMLEGYYGKYPRPVLRDSILRYVKDYSPADLDVLMRELLLTYSGQYRHTPDIAVMEKAKGDINSRSAIKQIGKKLPDTALIEDMAHLTSGEIVAGLARVKAELPRGKEREVR